MHPPPSVVPALLARAGAVEANPNSRSETVLTAVSRQLALDRNRALESRPRIREGHEESVTCMIHFFTAMAGEALPRREPSSRAIRSVQARSPIASMSCVEPTMSLKKSVRRATVLAESGGAVGCSSKRFASTTSGPAPSRSKAGD